MNYMPLPETNNNLYLYLFLLLLLLLLLEFLIQAFCQPNQTRSDLKKTRVVVAFSSPRLCFEFGLELDDVTSQKAMAPRHYRLGFGR